MRCTVGDHTPLSEIAQAIEVAGFTRLRSRPAVVPIRSVRHPLGTLGRSAAHKIYSALRWPGASGDLAVLPLSL
jgi:hypothetical protein